MFTQPSVYFQCSNVLIFCYFFVLIEYTREHISFVLLFFCTHITQMIQNICILKLPKKCNSFGCQRDKLSLTGLAMEVGLILIFPLCNHIQTFMHVQCFSIKFNTETLFSKHSMRRSKQAYSQPFMYFPCFLSYVSNLQRTM